eukprot:1243965-Rhodomonas_salina.1
MHGTDDGCRLGYQGGTLRGWTTLDLKCPPEPDKMLSDHHWTLLEEMFSANPADAAAWFAQDSDGLGVFVSCLATSARAVEYIQVRFRRVEREMTTCPGLTSGAVGGGRRVLWETDIGCCGRLTLGSVGADAARSMP